MKRTFCPQIVSIFKSGYSAKLFFNDLIAGTITGVVALPLAIAFSIASGLSPEQGLYTAIIAGFLISLLSGSKVQIGGPTGAFIVIVSGIVAKYGVSGLLISTIMAGVMMILMGALRLGNAVKFIPYSVTLGFTSGIAMLIALSQLPALMEVKSLSLSFSSLYSSFNPWSLLLGIGTIVIIQLWPRVTSKIPGSMIALVLGTLLVKAFSLPVETLFTRFGEINSSFPSMTIPEFVPERILQLLPSAISIAMLGAIESLLSAVVADQMTGEKHRSNTELIAQGIANIISPVFAGMPATGAIARTATNIKNGGKTPIAGIVHASVLLFIVLCCGNLAALIPMPVLAGILLVVSAKMSEINKFIQSIKAFNSDTYVMLITFLLTVFIDLTVAIPVGIITAFLLKFSSKRFNVWKDNRSLNT